MGEGDTLLNAAVGAVVTVLLSFTVFSPLLGGGVAGYLQAESTGRGAKVGAISGAIAAIPALLLLGLGLVFFLGTAAMGPGGFGLPGGVELLVVLFVLLPLLFVWSVGLGAAGGYLGAYLHQESGATGTRVPSQ